MAKVGEMGYYWFLELLVADLIVVSIDASMDTTTSC